MAEISAIQDKQTEVFSYAWAPDRDYFSERHRPGDFFRSRAFCSHKHRNIQWTLELYPHGRTDPNYMSVYLELLPTTRSQSVVANFKFAFLSYAGIEIKADGLAEFRCPDTMTHFSDLYGYDMGEHDFGENNKCGAEKSVNQFFILHGLSKSKYAPVTTCCEISVQPSEMSDIKIPPCCLSRDLGALLASGEFSDVTLTTKPDQSTISITTLRPHFTPDMNQFKLLGGAITTGELTHATSSPNKFSGASMPTGEIAHATSSPNKFSGASMTTGELTHATSSTNKFSGASMTTGELEDVTLNSNKLPGVPMTTDELEDVTSNKLSGVPMTTDELEDTTLNSNKLLGVLMTTDELADTTLNSNKLPDVPMTTGQPMVQVFHAHKAILSARSKVFKAMFTHNLQETQNSHVVIQDMTAKALGGMLQFIYTGEVDDLEGQVEELLAAAEKYVLGRLKSMCEHHLSKNQTTDNITHILLLADLYNATNLREQAIKFIKRSSNEVISTPAWKTFIFSHPQLAIEILMDVATVERGFSAQMSDINNVCDCDDIAMMF